MDTTDGERNINKFEMGRPDRRGFPLVALTLFAARYIEIFQGSLSALTEDNGPGFRRRSAPVAHSWGCVLEARGRRADTVVVPDIHTPCRVHLG